MPQMKPLKWMTMLISMIIIIHLIIVNFYFLPIYFKKNYPKKIHILNWSWKW